MNQMNSASSASDLETVEALVEWVNGSFERLSIHSLEALSDGLLIADMLHDIINSSNWAVGLTNLKKIVENLALYYEEVLHFDADFDSINLSNITRDKDVTEIIKVMEWILVAAVKSPDRARDYISKIMELSAEHQGTLKAIIESTMNMMQQSPPLPSSGNVNAHIEELQALLQKTQEEKESLSSEVIHLKERISLSFDRTHSGEERLLQEELQMQRQAAKLAAQKVEEYKSLHDQLALKSEEKDMYVEQLRGELDIREEKIKADREKYGKMEETNRRLADEVDVLKEKASQVLKLEVQIEKYKERIEQMSSARQQLKSLDEQNAKYVEQILSLEEKVRTIPTLKKAVDQYKEKVLELEREKFKALECVQVKEAEMLKLKKEQEMLEESKHFIEEEVRQLRALQKNEEVVQDSQRAGQGLFDDSLELREKVVRLECENKMLREKMLNVDAMEGKEGEIELLRSQLQDLEQVKAEREEELLESKRMVMQLEEDLTALREQKIRVEEEYIDMKKSHGVKTEVHEKIVSDLKGKVDESEKLIMTLRGEKDRLEQYTKDTLQVVQEKYVQTLESLKSANEELKDRNRELVDRLAKEKSAMRKEERLLMSAVYELGMDMIGNVELGRGATDKASGPVGGGKA